MYCMILVLEGQGSDSCVIGLCTYLSRLNLVFSYVIFV